MPERVDRATVKVEVIQLLTEVTRPEVPITDEDTRLFEDLGMTALERRAMAVPYSDISRRHGGETVGQDDAEELETVEESIDLVHESANA